MEEIGKQLFDILTKNVDFKSVMVKRLFPVIAAGDVKTPYSVYRLRQFPQSSDGDVFDISLLSVFAENKATEAMRFNDKIVEFFKNCDEFAFVSSEVDYMDETKQILIAFNLKTI